MPFPFLIPPLLAGAASALGITALVRTLAKEWQRVNDELDRMAQAEASVQQRDVLPKLRRDPHTGVFRPE